jgi:gamma-glutamylcyclotransferase (GGCT)/AIG2-like uncharacterized protein YtfP
MNNLLFIYGTLLNDNNDYGIYLKNNSFFYSHGKLQGKLYDVGEYPGAVLTDEKGSYIYGDVLEIIDPAEVLKIIDDYEGYGEHQPQPNEFVRVLTEVETDAGAVTCWLYLYNLPVSGLRLIEEGRYIK